MSRHLEPQQIAGFDALSGEQRVAALAHLRDCGGCRAAWITEDPARVFALLGAVPIPESRLESLSARVREEIRPAPRRWFGAASIAASLLLAAVLGAALWNHELPSAPLARIDEIGMLEPLPPDAGGMRVVASSGDDARWFDLKIGETQFLLIFDESIEL